MCEIFDDADDAYWAHNELFASVIEEHAPLKTKTIRKNQAPFMNSNLRKAIFQRNMWRNKFYSDRRNLSFRENYSMWRNKVSNLRKKSIKEYIGNRCNKDIGSKNFFNTLKPFLSNKSSFNSGNRIILRDDDRVISNISEVANIFNDYFASIAEYSDMYDGLNEISLEDILCKHMHHVSIRNINDMFSSKNEFSFSPVSSECIEKYILKLQTKKAIGHDGIHPMFLKLSSCSLSPSLSFIFNKCISSGIFPNSLKMAEICPVFKKKDSLLKENYRSVNLLVVVSKVFERVMADQIIAYFQSILSSSLSAYRKGYNCQHVVLQLTEFWRKSLDDDLFVGTVAMDLSKAFDTMPHALLIAKLNAYGLNNSACNVVISYLKNRHQRVKVMGEHSKWVTINRGVPQGSVLGPLLFNIFINDLFYAGINSPIANYADDNHIYNSNKDFDLLLHVLENDTATAINWFNQNYMNANADKFHTMIMNRKGSISTSISVENIVLPSEDNLNVLGINLDAKMKFDKHISNIAKRASQQINVLQRLSKFLCFDSRLLVYNSFISSNFKYCPVTWMFCGKSNVSKLEKIQERALRFVYRDMSSSYEFLLQKGRFLSLSMFRVYFLAVEVYKCVRGSNPPYLNDLFQKQKLNYRLRDTDLLVQSKFKTYRFGYKSFSYYGAKVWNTLALQIKQCDNLASFKYKLKLWCLGSDTCNIDDF